MADCVQKLLRKIDLFGFPVGVFLAGKSRYKSAFSGFLTLSLLVVFVAITINYFISILSSENIQIKELRKHYSIEDSISVNSKGLMFAIGFANTCLYNYLNISVRWRSQIKSAENGFKETKANIPLVNCTPSHFENTKDYFNKFNLSKYLCPSLDSSYNLTGAYTDNLFSFLNIYVSFSSGTNFSSIPNCPYKNQNFEVFTTSFHIAADDVSEPAKPIIMSEIYFPLNSIGRLKVSRDIFFNPIEIQTKTNNILPIGNVSSVIKVHSYDPMNKDIINILEEPTDKNQTVDFLSLYFRMAFTRTIFQREFSTFTDFLAYIGGVWNPLFLVFMAVGQYYNKRTSFINLANQLYNFKLEDSELLNFRKVDGHGRRNATENIRKTSYQSNLKSDILSDLEFYLKRDRALIINIFDLIRFWLSCLLCLNRKKREKREVYKTAIHNLTQDLDLLYILRSLQDLEKLKNILFDKNQLVLFNFTPKPTISTPNKRVVEALEKLKNIRHELPRELTRIALSPEDTEINLSRISQMQTTKKKTRDGTNTDWFRKNIHSRSRLFEKSANYSDIGSYRDLLRAYFLLKKRKSLSVDGISRNFQEEVNEKLTHLIDVEMSNLKRLLSVSEEDFFRWINNGSINNITETIPETSPSMRIRIFKPPPENTIFMSSENEIPEETDREEERIELPNFGELMDTRRSELDTKREMIFKTTE